MINQQVLTGNWREVSGKLKAKWGKLTDNDLRTFDGNVEQLVGRLQQKTGATRDAIEQFLDDTTQAGAEGCAGVREQIGRTANQAVEGAREGYAAAERVVEEHPAPSVAVAFGLGLISGVGLVLLLRERPQESRMSQARTAAEHLGRQILDAMSGVVPDAVKNMHRG